MKTGIICMDCMLSKELEKARAMDNDEDAVKYMKSIMKISLNAPEDMTGPYKRYLFDREYEKYCPRQDRYKEIKAKSNEYVLELLPEVRRRVEKSGDPLLSSLQYAKAGNYIDFGALGDNVKYEYLNELLGEAVNGRIENAEYSNFRTDLEKAKKLLYIMDNAGEIVLDMLFIEELKKAYPCLEICAAVRGDYVFNDATMFDAESIGLTKIIPVVDSGVPIYGTVIDMVSAEMRREIEGSDIILAKGQGNFEGMWGCGHNVYYLFLCKCRWFMHMFNVPQMTGMFVNERRVQPRI